MGYNTKFEGKLKFAKPLSDETKKYINNFFRTRHYKRDANLVKDQLQKHGINISEITLPYGPHKGELGEECCFITMDKYEEEIFEVNENGSVQYPTYCKDYNKPPEDCPSLWCNWRYDEKENALYLINGKTYYYTEWLEWLIKNIFAHEPNKLKGRITWQGEDIYDRGYFIVDDNKVKIVRIYVPEKVYIVSEKETINCSEHIKSESAFISEKDAINHFEMLKNNIKENDRFFNENGIAKTNCKETCGKYSYEIREGDTYDNSVLIEIKEYDIE